MDKVIATRFRSSIQCLSFNYLKYRSTKEGLKITYFVVVVSQDPTTNGKYRADLLPRYLKGACFF